MRALLHDLLALEILVVVPQTFRVDFEFGAFSGCLVEQLPRVVKLILVHSLDVGYFPGDRLLGGLHLPRQPGILSLQVTHLVDITRQTIVKILQILLFL